MCPHTLCVLIPYIGGARTADKGEGGRGGGKKNESENIKNGKEWNPDCVEMALTDDLVGICPERREGGARGGVSRSAGGGQSRSVGGGTIQKRKEGVMPLGVGVGVGIGASMKSNKRMKSLDECTHTHTHTHTQIPSPGQETACPSTQSQRSTPDLVLGTQFTCFNGTEVQILTQKAQIPMRKLQRLDGLGYEAR
jgi:hypothetical protein